MLCVRSQTYIPLFFNELWRNYEATYSMDHLDTWNVSDRDGHVATDMGSSTECGGHTGR